VKKKKERRGKKRFEGGLHREKVKESTLKPKSTSLEDIWRKAVSLSMRGHLRKRVKEKKSLKKKEGLSRVAVEFWERQAQFSLRKGP